jgi:hypothetical protein
MKDLKTRVLTNNFVNRVFTEMEIDADEYSDLRDSLHELSGEWEMASKIDKELALYLYCAPLMIRNVFLRLSSLDPVPEIASQLEDIWVELDQLVTDCFSPRSEFSL